jgi:hypothetical protein
MKPVPKPPKDSKRKPLSNGYKNKQNRICFYCRTPRAERHEVYGGHNRQISIREGFQVDLCPTCHKGIHEQVTQEDKARKEYWQQHYQQKYETKLIDTGIRPEQARALWIGLIGKSYL